METIKQLETDDLKEIRRYARRAEQLGTQLDAATLERLREQVWQELNERGASAKLNPKLQLVLLAKKIAAMPCRGAETRRRKGKSAQQLAHDLFGELPAAPPGGVMFTAPGVLAPEMLEACVVEHKSQPQP